MKFSLWFYVCSYCCSYSDFLRQMTVLLFLVIFCLFCHALQSRLSFPLILWLTIETVTTISFSLHSHYTLCRPYPIRPIVEWLSTKPIRLLAMEFASILLDICKVMGQESKERWLEWSKIKIDSNKKCVYFKNKMRKKNSQCFIEHPILTCYFCICLGSPVVANWPLHSVIHLNVE